MLLLATATTSCASESGKVAPLGISVEGDRNLTLNVTFAVMSAAQADITELAAEVRVDNISGKSIDGDCFSQVTLRLDQPLGTRALVVEGTTWQRVLGDCPYGEFGPGDLELASSCEFPP